MSASTFSPTLAARGRQNGRSGPRERVLELVSLAYVVCIPLDEVQVLSGRSLSAVVGTIVLIVWVGTLLTGTKGEAVARAKAPVGLYLLFTAFVAWGLVRFSESIDPDTSLSRSLTYIGVFLLVPALASGFRDAWDRPLVAYVVSAAALSLSLLFQLLTSRALPDFRASEVGLNSNQAALMVAIGSVFSLLLLSRAEGRARIYYLGAVLLCTAGGLSTGSRTGLIAMVVALVASLLVIQGGPLRARMIVRILLTLAVVFVILWALRDIFPNRLSDTIWSIQERDLTRRQDIWEAALWYRDAWIPWGTGVGTASLFIGTIYIDGVVAHNALLEAVIEGGYVGLLLAVAILIAVVLAARHSPYRIYVWAAMIPIGAFIMSTSLMHFKVLWLVAALAATRARPESATLGQ